MNFHEVQFPRRLALGATGGPERKTDIVALASGFEERNALWAGSLRRYDVGYAMTSAADLHAVLAFFEARSGRLYGFRFHDAIDNQSAPPGTSIQPTDQTLGTGDGTTAVFQLVKAYISGGATSVRKIQKPVSGTARIAVGGAEKTLGTDFSLDTTTGLVTFLAGHIPAASQSITAGFQFDVPVRFDTDRLEINFKAFQAGEIPHIPLVEVRL